MNIYDKLMLNFYPELKNLNIDDDTLKQIISNKNFKQEYKSTILPFIKYLKQLGIDEDTIKQHLNAVFNLSINNNSNKYISFIKKYHLETRKTENFNIINDINFETLYSLIGYDVFNNNIVEIINNGYSNNLIEFIKENNDINLEQISSKLFEEKVWNIIKNNPIIGDTTILKLFKPNLNILVNLIDKGYYEGLKYTYENIPESRKFIKENLFKIKEESLSFDQFSMDFINNIGDETLSKLYAKSVFSNKNVSEKILKIASLNNYELIQDIVNYDKFDFDDYFEHMSENDMSKNLLETNIDGNYIKSEIFLNKYFGIERNDVNNIKLFLDAINDAIKKGNNISDEFREKYGSIIELINQIMVSTDEELIRISKTMDTSKKDIYKKLITSCERDGNKILKKQFADEIKIKNQEILNTATHKEIITDDGKSISVYELTGQPFAMLVHAIEDNPASINNSYVKELINNPEKWDKIDGGNNHLSTSLIFDKHIKTYGTPDRNGTIMFGFNDIPYDSIKFTEVGDAGLNRKATVDDDDEYNMRYGIINPRVNTITTVDDLMKKTLKNNEGKTHMSKQWTEIGLTRTDQNTGLKIKPNFIVCMDRISDDSLRAAKQLNLPIYLIDRKYYVEEIRKLYEEDVNNILEEMRKSYYGEDKNDILEEIETEHKKR